MINGLEELLYLQEQNLQHGIIIIIIKGIYIVQVRKGHKCAMSPEIAVWSLY